MNITHLTAKDQDNMLLNDILQRNYFDTFDYNYIHPFGNPHRTSRRLKDLTFIFPGEKSSCGLCDYEIPLTGAKENCIDNLKKFLSWYKEKNFACDIHLMGMDTITLEELTDIFSYIEESFIIRFPINITIDLDSTNLNHSIISLIKEKNRLFELKYHLTLILNITIHNFNLSKEDYLLLKDLKVNYKVLLHPDKVENYTEMFKTFISNLNLDINTVFEDFNISLIDSENWSEDKMLYLHLFLDFYIDVAYEHYCNSDIDRFLQYIFENDNFISIKDQQVLDNTWEHDYCAFYNSLCINLDTLEIAMCPGLFKVDLAIGKFVCENNKITGKVEAMNLELIVITDHLKKSSNPKCEHCYETDLCHGYCHAAAYEVSYNPLIPIMEGCEMRRGKLLFLVYKYKQMGIFDSLEFFEYRDKLTKNFDWYLNSIVQRYVKE